MLGAMPSRYRRQDRGAYLADASLHKLGYELHEARLSAGLSLRRLEEATGVSRSQLARLERGLAPEASLRMLTVTFAVLGMRLSARPYPEGSPLRDAAHARLLDRLRRLLAPSMRLRLEVPLRGTHQLRAWDAELVTTSDTCKVEAETALHDLQATDRKIALKMADDGVDRVILLVAQTRRNRRVLGEFRELTRARYPLDTRSVVRELRAGRLPQQSGIILL